MLELNNFTLKTTNNYKIEPGSLAMCRLMRLVLALTSTCLTQPALSGYIWTTMPDGHFACETYICLVPKLSPICSFHRMTSE